MEEITKYILNMLEIMETELKLIRLGMAKTAKGISWFGMGVFLLGMGLILLAWTAFTGLSMLIGKVGAGFATSLLILLLGGVFLWQGSKTLK
ncbi:MAG TPA: hypothetical protein DIT32_07945 [Peptococcaceae bacterium]|nr:hypothetical protein [Peptococcaceae bacterium]